MSATTAFHPLPTHLGVRDPVLWGLDDVQLLKLGAGAIVAGCVWRQSLLPVGLRVVVCAAAVLAAFICATVRIDGRPLDEWLVIVGRFLVRPRTLVWRSRRPDHAWARGAAAVGPLAVGEHTRYCLRNIRVRWVESTQRSAP
jgi:hypothetical protein